jgi:endonuclease-3
VVLRALCGPCIFIFDCIPMTKAEKVKDILKILDKYFPDPDIPLDHKDAYTLLISVLLSAQCTDERVNKTTPTLFRLADNPFDMAKIPVDEIREIIKPCGLSPAKSKAISKLSQILIDKYNGEVPNTFEALEELPGVGHKTASVVMTQMFGMPAFPVDTHIHRLAYRWGLSNGKSVEQTEKDLKRLIPQEKWDKAHLQIIYFGRKFCPARGHIWTECPICSKYMRKELRDSG